MRHEELLVRVEVGDLRRVVVVAAGCSRRQPDPRDGGEGAGGIAVALLCLEGHIVLHCAPSEGACLVEIIARAPADVWKGIDVISRRLGS